MDKETIFRVCNADAATEGGADRLYRERITLADMLEMYEEEAQA